MSYLSSSDIRVFPAVNRSASSGDVYARHTSEEVLAGIVNKLIDTDGFVITQKKDFGLSKPFAFNLHGYYFKTNKNNTYNSSSNTEEQSQTVDTAGTLQSIIDSLGSSFSTGDVIYATICIKKIGDWYELSGSDEIIAGDSAASYTGIKFEVFSNIGSSDTASAAYQHEQTVLGTQTETSNEIKYTLALVEKVAANSTYDTAWGSNGWVVPDSSRIKFDASAFKLDRIDGGRLYSVNVND